jgi:uncharacterized lipoprotein YmbA
MKSASTMVPTPTRATPRGARMLLALAASALAAGCASAPDRYYTLAEPVAATIPGAAGTAGAAGPVPASGLFIDIAPVAMPERLARPQLVVSRTGMPGAEVALLEQHRWTSSFESELRDALAAGIATRLGATDVTKGARLAGAPAWRVAVQLQRLDLIEDQRADAAFSWTVRRGLPLEWHRSRGRWWHRGPGAGRAASDGSRLDADRPPRAGAPGRPGRGLPGRLSPRGPAQGQSSLRIGFLRQTRR